MPANTETNAEDRLQAIRQWATAAVAGIAHLEASDSAQVQWQTVSGDASFRRYFRIHSGERSYIVMDAPPSQEQLAPFIDIAGRLRLANVLAPRIFAQDLRQGFLLLEDFGDQMVKALLHADSGQPLFDRVLPILSAMAANCTTDGLPDYSPASLQRELDLFPDWYLSHHRSITLSQSEQAQWSTLCELLQTNAAQQPQVFVHRDFHSCNLHVLSDNDHTGVIDFQDAVRGPLTYDLASWLWDRYITWPRDALLHWMEQARAVLAPQIASAQWVRWCDLMGLQRNLKIVGIFARLYYRDGKSGYLELIPQFAAYILDVLPRYPELYDYRGMLEAQLSAAVEAG